MRHHTETLLISACIIGVYIAGVLLIGEREVIVQEQHFYVGCFVGESNVSQSVEIDDYVRRIGQRVGGFLGREFQRIGDGEFSSKGYEAAVAFEDYLVDLNKFKENMARTLQISKAIKTAAADVQLCQQNALKTSFRQSHCQQTWQQYQNCSTKLSEYKSQITKLLTTKIHLSQTLHAHLTQAQAHPSPTIPTQKQKQHKIKDKQLQNKQKILQANVRSLEDRILAAEFSRVGLEDRIGISERNVLECIQLRVEFRLCQEVADQVRGLGYGDIDSLERKLEKKKESVMKVKNLLKNQQAYSNQNIVNQKITSLQQYKRLFKIFTELKLKSMKSCGCSQEKQASLKKILQEQVKEKEKVMEILSDLKKNLKQQKQKLKNIKNERQNLIQSLTNLPTTNTQNSQPEQTPTQTLATLKSTEQQINTKILDYRYQIQQLDSTCGNYKKSLSLLLGSIEEISRCRAKKQYLTNLRKYLSEDKEEMKFKAVSQEKLVKVLKQFVL